MKYKILFYYFICLLLISCKQPELPKCFDKQDEILYEVEEKGQKYVVKAFSKKGFLLDSLTLDNCQIDGLRKSFDNNTRTYCLANYHKDTLNGSFIIYGVNGIKQVSGNYSLGRKSGDWIGRSEKGGMKYYNFYDFNGNLCYRRVYSSPKDYSVKGYLMSNFIFMNGVKEVKEILYGNKVSILTELALPPNSISVFSIKEIGVNGSIINSKVYTPKDHWIEDFSYEFVYNFKKSGMVSLEIKYEIQDTISNEKEYVKMRKAFFITLTNDSL